MIKLIKSTFYHEAETKEKLIDFIRSAEILSMSDECKKFETAFTRKQGRKFAVLVNSGSSANLLLVQALLNLGKLKKGDKVGISALTWATNVMPLIQLGLEPVAIDCELNTLNVSSRTLEPYLSSIKALFLTNVLGFSSDIDNIQRLCSDKNIIFLEDNCESLGSRVGGHNLGNFGLASTFSFFVGHHLSLIEGGLVCTDDEDLYNALLLARAHSWDRNLPMNTQRAIRQENNIDDFFARYTFYDLGYNLRPTEITGFLGNTQLPYWDEIVKIRVSNFTTFHNAISVNDDFIPLAVSHMELVSNFAMPVLCRDNDKFIKYRKKFEGQVEIRPIIAGDITKHPFWSKYVSKSYVCPNASFIHNNGFYFANNPELVKEEVDLLCSLLKP
jgi:CDP-6-deoxy-D-xylo-4-hexulose-3-dehydrase